MNVRGVFFEKSDLLQRQATVDGMKSGEWAIIGTASIDLDGEPEKGELLRCNGKQYLICYVSQLSRIPEIGLTEVSVH